MTQIWRAYGDLFMAGACLGVPAGLAVYLWRVRQLVAARVARPWLLASCEVVPLLLSVLALVITLQPGPAGMSGHAVELIPFQNLRADGLWQIAGNCLLLAPAGALVAVAGFRRAWVPGLPLLIEAVQLLAVPGRVASTEDALLGVAGMLGGWWTAQRVLPYIEGHLRATQGVPLRSQQPLDAN